MTKQFWTCAMITLISVTVSVGFSVAGLLGPTGGNEFARYAASRSIAILLAVLCCFVVHSRAGIAALALLATMMQGFDAVVGCLAHDPAKTYGPLVLAVINAAALVWLLRSRSARELLR